MENLISQKLDLEKFAEDTLKIDDLGYLIEKEKISLVIDKKHKFKQKYSKFTYFRANRNKNNSNDFIFETYINRDLFDSSNLNLSALLHFPCEYLVNNRDKFELLYLRVLDESVSRESIDDLFSRYVEEFNVLDSQKLISSLFIERHNYLMKEYIDRLLSEVA